MRYDNIIWDFDGTLFDTYPPMCRDLQSVMALVRGGDLGQPFQFKNFRD